MLDFNFQLDDFEEEETFSLICKGLIYRGHSAVYQTKNGGFACKKWVTPIIRKSCPGCPKCYPILDQVSEFMMDKEYDFGLSAIEEGKLYTFTVTDVHTDWESGMVDSWDLTFIETEENKS